MSRTCFTFFLIVGIALVSATPSAQAQSFGIELHNTLMPASGAMGGASLARPQDVQSAVGGNPATLARFYGTQFSTNGTWIESTLDMQHTGNGVLPGVGPFSAKSEAEGSALGGFALAQDVRALGLPATLGMALFADAGAGLSFKNVPPSNGTSDVISVLTIASSVGVELTERLSVGATINFGTANMYGPFIGISSASYDYALRGGLGLTYDVTNNTSLGLHYETKQSFNFDDAIRLQLPLGGYSVVSDINMDLPRNVSIGVANESLFSGRLLLAADVLYKNWSDADFWEAVYTDQWVVQFGSQYRLSDRLRLRAGYVIAENATNPDPGTAAGGVAPPGLQNAIQYIQAQIPAINQHRISAGIGVRDVLPGIDLDMFAGGMFNATENYGAFTSASLESYWAGMGLTWRFGRGQCCRLPVDDQWNFP